MPEYSAGEFANTPFAALAGRLDLKDAQLEAEVRDARVAALGAQLGVPVEVANLPAQPTLFEELSTGAEELGRAAEEELRRLVRSSMLLTPDELEECTDGQRLVHESRRIAAALLTGAHMLNTLNTVQACDACRWAGADPDLHRADCQGHLYEADIVIIGKEAVF